MGKIINSRKFCYIMSVIFYSVAIITWISGDGGNFQIIWLCFGSMWLCISSVYPKKSKKDEGKSK